MERICIALVALSCNSQGGKNKSTQRTVQVPFQKSQGQSGHRAKCVQGLKNKHGSSHLSVLLSSSFTSLLNCVGSIVSSVNLGFCPWGKQLTSLQELNNDKYRPNFPLIWIPRLPQSWGWSQTQSRVRTESRPGSGCWAPEKGNSSVWGAGRRCFVQVLMGTSYNSHEKVVIAATL